MYMRRPLDNCLWFENLDKSAVDQFQKVLKTSFELSHFPFRRAIGPYDPT